MNIKSRFLIAALLSAGIASAGGPFSLEVLSYPSAFPLGAAPPYEDSHGTVEGWLQPRILVEAVYHGEKQIPVVMGDLPGFRDGTGRLSVFAEVTDQTGAEVAPCRPKAQIYTVMVGAPTLAVGWTERYEVPVCLPGVGTYHVRAVLQETACSYTSDKGEVFELWTGRVESEPIVVQVDEPVGIDLQAYEALDESPTDRSRRAELLSRFPTSTYAAYVIWEKWAKGWAAVETKRAVEALNLGFTHERGLIWCDATTRLTPGSETRLSGEKYVRCRDEWLSLALKHHPSIWFADEARLRLALDQYLLGGRADSDARLTDLAKHGKSDVAAKARDLLAAMRAKGMLEAVPEGTAK